MNHIETINIVYQLAYNNNQNQIEFDRRGVFAGLVYLYSKLGEVWMQQRVPSGISEVHLDKMNKIAKRITMDEPLHFQLSRSMRLIIEIIMRELLTKEKKRQDELRKRLDKYIKETIGTINISLALLPGWFIGADFYYRCTVNACRMLMDGEVEEWYPQRAQSVLGECFFTRDPKKFEQFMYKYGVLDDLGNEYALSLSVAVLEVMERFSMEDEKLMDPFYQYVSESVQLLSYREYMRDTPEIYQKYHRALLFMNIRMDDIRYEKTSPSEFQKGLSSYVLHIDQEIETLEMHQSDKVSQMKQLERLFKDLKEYLIRNPKESVYSKIVGEFLQICEEDTDCDVRSYKNSRNTCTLDIAEQTYLMKRGRLQKSLNTSKWIGRILKESNKLRKLKYGHLIHLPLLSNVNVNNYNNNINTTATPSITITPTNNTQSLSSLMILSSISAINTNNNNTSPCTTPTSTPILISHPIITFNNNNNNSSNNTFNNSINSQVLSPSLTLSPIVTTFQSSPFTHNIGNIMNGTLNNKTSSKNKSSNTAMSINNICNNF